MIKLLAFSPRIIVVGVGPLALTHYGLGLDHIFIWMGPAPPTPPSLPSLHARTCVGTLLRWELM